MNELPSVWAVVPCFNRTASTLRFLKNFFQQNYKNKHVVIVDDDSKDNTSFNVSINFPDVHVLHGDGNLWWSGGTNLGIVYALKHHADYILTINDDAQYSDNLISSLYETAKLNRKYIVGSVIVEEGRESKIWSIGSTKDFISQRLMTLNFAGEDVAVLDTLENPFPVEFMPGNGVLLPSEVFEKVGFYDEANMPQYHADSDLVLRASKYGGFLPVISHRSVIINNIITTPIVTNIKDLLFSKKSDLYWPAIAAFALRNHPEMSLARVFTQVYRPFFSNEIEWSRIFDQSLFANC